MRNIDKQYFTWMCNLLYDNHFPTQRFDELFSYLHTKTYTYTMDMDQNRYEDGISLRYRFGYDIGLPNVIIRSDLDNTPCSIFEMMVALALRIEDDIMDLAGEKRRIGIWFYDMLRSLGLEACTDELLFDTEDVDYILNRFLSKEYNEDGSGGLFTVPEESIKELDIWYQMHRYLRYIDS